MESSIRKITANQTATTIADAFLSGETLLPLISDNYLALPGFCDVHVHFREPGFCYKEDIESGSKSASRGGYTAVCTMPNLNPVPDSLETLKPQLESIRKNSVIAIIPYGSITKEQKGKTLSDMDDIAPYVCAFSDDGRGVQDDQMMKDAMVKAKSLGKMIVAHCEVNSLLNGGYIHDGDYAKTHGHRGICSQSEYLQIARDIELVREIGCAYHVCHVSTKESVDIIRKAKAEGLDVSCETAPHYLVLCDDDLQEDGRFKMNPPLRSKEDRDALIEGIKDGTIEILATDHAPHGEEEKSRGLEKSLFGIVGLETAFPIMFTHLVKKGIISLEKLVEIMCVNPRKRFNVTTDIGCTVFEINTPYQINPDDFLSKGKATPFTGETVYGKCVLTKYNGKTVYENLER